MSVDSVLVVQRVRINPVFVPLQLAFCVPYYKLSRQNHHDRALRIECSQNQ